MQLELNTTVGEFLTFANLSGISKFVWHVQPWGHAPKNTLKIGCSEMQNYGKEHFIVDL